MELRIFIGPESVHSVLLSQTGWVTKCCLLDLIDTLAVESVNPRQVLILLLILILALRKALAILWWQITWQVLDNSFWRIIWPLLRLLVNSSHWAGTLFWSIPPPVVPLPMLIFKTRQLVLSPKHNAANQTLLSTTSETLSYTLHAND